MDFKVRYFSKEIICYFVVAGTFIPIAMFIKSFKLGYWFNIGATMVVCMGIYGVYLLVTKDPLADTALKILKKQTRKRE